MQSHVDSASATNVPDIMSANDDFEFDIDREVTANETSPSHASVMSARATRSLQGYAIATLLDLMGSTGLAVVTTVNPGIGLYLQKFDDLGSPSAGSVHRSLTVKSGWLIPRTLSCDHQGHATLSFDVVIIKKSGTDAVVISDVAALPTITISPARWTLGPIDFGNITLSQYRSVEIDFGNEVNPGGVQSDIWDAHIENKTSAPRITVRGISPTWFGASGITIGGAAGTHANTTVVLRKRLGDGSGDGFVSNGTAEHIEITSAGPVTVRAAADAQAQNPAEQSLVIESMKDSSGNAPLIIDTTATY